MNAHISTHDQAHHLGESATHPIELRCGTLAALHRITVHSDVSLVKYPG